jgi:hypothetical protein
MTWRPTRLLLFVSNVGGSSFVVTIYIVSPDEFWLLGPEEPRVRLCSALFGSTNSVDLCRRVRRAFLRTCLFTQTCASYYFSLLRWYLADHIHFGRL